MPQQIEIDYDELDDDIVDIVKAMNQFEGIQTTSSCAGHNSEGYVCGFVRFKANSLDSLVHFLEQLPHSGFGLGGRPAYWGSAVHVRYVNEELHFTLRMGGMDKAVQREWLAETERELSSSVGGSEKCGD